VVAAYWIKFTHITVWRRGEYQKPETQEELVRKQGETGVILRGAKRDSN